MPSTPRGIVRYFFKTLAHKLEKLAREGKHDSIRKVQATAARYACARLTGDYSKVRKGH